MKLKLLNRIVFFLFLAIFALSLPPTLLAQVTGTISGYIHDPSGAMLPNVQVTATSVEEHTTRSAESDTTGFYNLLSLPRGHYTLTATLTGFVTETRSNVELTSGGAPRIDFDMSIGQVSQSVNVQSVTPIIETTTATQSTLIDDRRVQDLPLNGRNVIGLANTLSEAVAVTTSQTMADARSGPIMSISGGSQNGNYYTLNGATFMNFDQTTGFNPPPPDAIQEIRIQTHDFPAEYGFTASSQTSMVSKSGSNQFHGTAWEFYRGNVLNATNYFLAKKPRQVQNQYGGSIGGPIWKNKLFFFASYQGLSERQSAASASFGLPTPLERTGNFTDISTTLRNPSDPITGKPLMASSGQPCIQNNVINPQCINSASQIILQQYIPVSPTNTQVTLSPLPYNNNDLFGRIDYNISSKDLLYFHYLRDHTDTSSLTGNLAYVSQSIYTNIYQAAVSEIHTFNPNLTNEGTFSFTVNKSRGGPTTTIAPSSLGVNVPLDPNGRGLTIGISGGPQLNYPGITDEYYNQFELDDSLSWIHGRHTFKFGYEGLQLRFAFKLALTRSVTFSSVETGNAEADFLLGRFDTATFNYGSSDNSPKGWKQALYVQDSFKVTPRLTVNYGLRWEPFLPFTQYTGTDLSWQPGVQSKVHPDAPVGILFAGDNGLPPALVYRRWDQFAPRLGFAWDLFGDSSTVIRGAAGTFFQSAGGDTTHSAQAPWEGQNILRNGRLDDPFGSLNQPLPPTAATLPGNFGCKPINTAPGLSCSFLLPITLVYTEPHLKAPTYEHFTLDVERQITSDWFAEASYVGLVSYNQTGHNYFNAARPINDPFTGLPPSAQNINDRVTYEPGIIAAGNRVLGNFYHSDYHALNLKVRNRVTHGFTIEAGYTLSKNITNLTDIGVGLMSDVSNPFDLDSGRGPSLLDHRHVIAISELWSPEVHLSNRFLQGAINGWTFTGLHRFQTGGPSNILMGSDVAENGTTNASTGQIALLAPGATARSVIVDHPNKQAEVSQYFNTSAFVPISQITPGTYGNARRGLIYGPNYFDTDLAVMRYVPLGTERLRAQFRGEFFNAFNQVNFDNPDTTRASGTFGRLTSAEPARVIQLALKLTW
jgi:hypothetical protein